VAISLSMFMLLENIQNRITQFLTKLILFVCNNINCNMRNLEKFILLGGYNQLIKGYQITKNKTFRISFSDGVPMQINLFGGITKRKVGNRCITLHCRVWTG